jgi:hypothetical protein
MAKVPNLRTFRPDEGDAKNVENTKMLDTTARESVDMNESNEVGKELINSEKISGPFGATGRE